MTRALIALVAFAAIGCTRTTMTSPTATADPDALQRDFTSLILPGGSASRAFDLTVGGQIAVTLRSTTPAGVTVGVGVGIPRSDGSCALQAVVETAAGATAQIAIAADAGAYCAKVYDLGTLRDPLPFTISISRP
jgi:hypothetical protein